MNFVLSTTSYRKDVEHETEELDVSVEKAMFWKEGYEVGQREKDLEYSAILMECLMRIRFDQNLTDKIERLLEGKKLIPTRISR